MHTTHRRQISIHTSFPVGVQKVKDYQRFYDIQQTNRCSIFFFAVETTGGLGKEARDYVKLLAKLAGGTLSTTILRIYQTLAVEFQCARANQVYITNRKYVTSTPPSSTPSNTTRDLVVSPSVTKKLAIFKILVRIKPFSASEHLKSLCFPSPCYSPSSRFS